MATPTNFAPLPGQSDLAQVPRDLSFHLCTNPHPTTLTPADLESFNRDGYLMPVRLFDTREIGIIRAYFDQLLNSYLAAGQDSYAISSAHLRHAPVYDLLLHPRIRAIVTDLLGPNVIAWGSHFFCKMPRDGKTVSWHQDASYWPLSPSQAVTVWLAIDDADRGNGCMKYIPGSHKYGHLTYQLSETDENNVLDQTVVNAEGIGSPVYVELRAGEAAIHSDLTLHGSDQNDSDRRRCGLTLRYTPSNVVAHLGWHEKGVVLAGERPAHWSHRDRPTADEPPLNLGAAS